jgi:hypothetical protein
VLIFVDAGAAITTRPLIDLPSACKAAKDAGVTVVVVGLKAAGYRNGGCATSGWARASADDDAADFPDIMDQIGVDLLKGMQAQGYEYVDAKRHDFEYVTGSAQPDVPTVDPLGDLSWLYNDQLPPGGRQITYKIKVPDAAVGNGYYVDTIQKPSLSAALWLYYTGGAPARPYSLPNPEICIHQVGDASFCDNAFVTPSPVPSASPPTETPGVTDTPTPTPTTVVADTATPTDVPPSPTTTDTGRIFLPSCLQAGEVRAGP